MARILAGEDPADGGPAPGPAALDRDPLLDRLHTFLTGAIMLMFNGVEPTEALALTSLACKVDDDAPQAEVCAMVLDLLERRREQVESGAGDGRPARFAPGLPLIVVAAAMVRTPDVPLPGRA